MKTALLLSILVSCLTACAVTRSDLDFNYRPEPVSLSSAQSLQGTSLRAVVVTDNRIDIFTNKQLTDRRVLLNKRAGHRLKTEGVFALGRPLTDYVQQAFEEALAQASVRQSTSSALELRVQIDSVDDPLRERGILSNDYYLDIAATAYLLDRDSGKEVWRERFLGRAKIDVQGTFDMGPYFAKTLPSTIADVVFQCLSSPALRSALLRGGAVG